MNPVLTPPPETRFVEAADAHAGFEPAGFLQGRVTFADMFGYHKPPRALFTLLRVFESRIVAAACFEVRPDDLKIDYLSRNGAFHASAPVTGAFALLEAIEGFCED